MSTFVYNCKENYKLTNKTLAHWTYSIVELVVEKETW